MALPKGAVNNNIFPDRHYVNLDFLATKWQGEPKNMETEKCEKIGWFDLNNLPEPFFEPAANFFNKNPKCLCQSGKLFKECHGKK
jgi:ADP-ribose pyrophosphatase YjhB (NUDIX family)